MKESLEGLVHLVFRDPSDALNVARKLRARAAHGWQGYRPGYIRENKNKVYVHDSFLPIARDIADRVTTRYTVAYE